MPHPSNDRLLHGILILSHSAFLEGDEFGPGIADDTEDENSANQIAGKIPNFCVLLHGSLKVEGMVAIVQLGYGGGKGGLAFGDTEMALI